jgi:hypothetical protein
MLAFMTSSSNNPVSLHTQEELSSLRQQVAESSVLRTHLETAQQEAAHNQSRAKELYNQLDAMSRRHEQVTAALLSCMQFIHQYIFSACVTHQGSQQTMTGQSAYMHASDITVRHVVSCMRSTA